MYISLEEAKADLKDYYNLEDDQWYLYVRTNNDGYPTKLRRTVLGSVSLRSVNILIKKAKKK